MLGLGFWEIIIIGIVALVVIGPERLPDFAKSVAKFLNEMKRTASDLKTTFDDEKDIFKENIDQIQKLKTDFKSMASLEEPIDKKIDQLHKSESIDQMQDYLHAEEQLDLLDPHLGYGSDDEHFECEDSNYAEDEVHPDYNLSKKDKDKV